MNKIESNLWDGSITVIGYGVHGKKHIDKHLEQGCKYLNIVDISEKAIDEASELKLNIYAKLFKPKKTPWLVDICTWNDSHVEYIIQSLELGADIILVEKPAVTNIIDAQTILSLSEKYQVPIYVSEQYLFSSGVKFSYKWFKNIKEKNNTNIFMELSKNRKDDFDIFRGGSLLKFTDIELPHIIASLRYILQSCNQSILDYKTIEVIKHNDFNMEIYLKYKQNIELIIKCNLLANKRKRILQIRTKENKLKVFFDLGGIDKKCKRIEIIQDSKGLNNNIECDSLNILIENIKKSYNKNKIIDKLLLKNFIDDIKFLNMINEYEENKNEEKINSK